MVYSNYGIGKVIVEINSWSQYQFNFTFVIDTKLIKVWKSIHNGPVSRVALSQDGEIMASGGSDSSVRLWNLKYHSCTHNLTGLQGVVR